MLYIYIKSSKNKVQPKEYQSAYKETDKVRITFWNVKGVNNISDFKKYVDKSRIMCACEIWCTNDPSNNFFTERLRSIYNKVEKTETR